MYGAILLVMDDGRVEFANQAFCEIFGLAESPESLNGLESEELTEKIKNAFLQPDEAVSRIQEIVRIGQPVKGEEVAMSGDRTCLRDFIPIVVNGIPYGRLWHHLDITERQQAAEELRQSEERYRTLFNTMIEGFCIIEVIFDSDSRPIDYRFLEMNPAFTDQTGLQNAQGRLMRELAPDHEAHWFEIYGKVALTGKPARFVNEAKALGRWYDVSAYRIGGPESPKVAILFNDITERMRAEEALRKAKDDLEERVKERTYELYTESLYARSLIEASLDPLVTISVDGKITDVNHASEEVTGVLREQLIGSDFSDYFTEPEKARVGYEEVFQQGFVRDYPLGLKRRDGHVTPVLYNASVYRDDTGLIMGVFAAARDITERKQAEAALRRLASELVMAEERERKRIAGVLHDDIAQILASVRMRLDMLQSIPSEQKDTILQEAKTLLVQSLQETRALMNDLGNPLLFDMGLNSACESLANRLMEKHPVRISCDVQDAFKDLNPDVKAIVYQLIRELLNNVVKHSKAQNAHVMIDMENGYFRLKVTDDGVGFDPQMLGAPTLEGGFGLYSIRERLIAVNGSLRIESSPGKGSIVTAILPVSLD
jgi:PAS domain S-box-containing protein